MACSQPTITEKTVELHEKIVKKEVSDSINSSPFWSTVVDENTDSSIIDKVIVCGRLLNMEEEKLETMFLGIAPVDRIPDRKHIFDEVNSVIEASHLPTDRLVGLSTDGAAVMLSEKKGVVANMMAAYKE
ncbi:UNVERIFIED_CONTAM: hypothetical protein FKN15_018623 [Acipenser sinensis]